VRRRALDLDDAPLARPRLGQRAAGAQPRHQPVAAADRLRVERRRRQDDRAARTTVAVQQIGRHLRHQLVLARLPAEDDAEDIAAAAQHALGHRPRRSDLIPPQRPRRPPDPRKGRHIAKYDAE
jgi:hypothetical protein